RRKEERATRAAAEALAAAQAAVAKSPPAAPASAGGFADSLMSDLESFTNQDEVEQKARAEAERSSKLEAERRRREVAEREAAEARRREEAEAQRREEESRRAREEEDRLAREEERRRREAEEIQRKAEAATAAAMARQAAASAEASPEQDIPIDDDDLDMTEVKKEQKALGIDEKKLREKEKQAEREARKRKRDEEKRRREAEKAAAKAAKAVAPSGRARRATSWSKPIALFLAFVLIVAIAAVHLVPLEVAPFEQAATQALGQPVRIGSARLWLFTGVQLRLENVRVGETRIREVHAHPSLAWLWDERKTFSLVELDRLSLPQAAFGEALLSGVRTEHFAVERVKVRSLELPGALVLPKPLEADVFFDAKGAPRSVTLSGPDGLDARILPKGDVVEFEATAGGLPLPIAPEVVLSKFAMKGRATRRGMDIAEWGGAIYNGAISGTARVRWGSSWDVDGAITVRGINAAVFAPALLSEGNAEGSGRFSMSAADPTKLAGTGRLEGRFAIGKGTLGSFDLSRAIQTRGKQVTGTTQFAELNGQVTYDRGVVALRNVTIGAGALNAGASADIGKGGALSGRIVADVRTAAQTLSATLNLGGTVREPVVHD
ncbi:MAG TPA: hypothetical protein VE935_07595, partial [Burkholderiales bacterium]|nr:hypothetical protein [Burkholderiales bacterium]